MHRLHHLECNEGKPEDAAKELLQAIKRSDEPGKWRTLVYALKEVSGDDSIFLHYLLDTKSKDDWLDNPEHRNLINVMKVRLYEGLHLKGLLRKMKEKDLISEEHIQKIKVKLEKKETAFAQMELIAAMQSHGTNWYRKFITILYHEDESHRELAEAIDPDFCKEKLSEKNEVEELTQEQKDAGTSLGDGDQTEYQATSANSSRTGDGYDPHELQASVVPAAQGSNRGELGTPSLPQTKATCGCQCCASLKSELREIKQLLMERAQKDSQ
ncbi:hypothetical protein ACOMHN_061311 [Nucella lapillus]